MVAYCRESAQPLRSGQYAVSCRVERNENLHDTFWEKRSYYMFACETQILQQLAVLVVCHGIAVGQITSSYFLVQRPMSWSKAREFCQRHYVDLAGLNTEEQYLTLLNATRGNKVSFWLGLQRQNVLSGWTWVNGEELSYTHWHRRNDVGCCASLEAMLEKDKRLLARVCDEPHMFVCQGPVSPQTVVVDLVRTDQLTLSWNISAFMKMTPHNYNVTTCTNTCNTLLYCYTDGSAVMNINISNLTSATEYFIEIAAFVVRPENVTGGRVILQSNPTALQAKTDYPDQYKFITVILKVLRPVALAAPLWILYCILKKEKSPVLSDGGEDLESDDDVSSVRIPTENTITYLLPEKTRGIG